MSDNLYHHLATAAMANFERVLLDCPDDITWTFGSLFRLAGQFSSELTRLGVTAGDRVLVQVDKSPYAVALYLGCLKAGAVYVPLNTAYTVSELCGFIDDADPALIVLTHLQARALESSDYRVKAKSVQVLDESDPGDWLMNVHAHKPTDDLLDNTITMSEDDPAAILFTSGTTGRSKGAVLSHGNLLSNARTLVKLWAMTGSDVLIHALPIFHIHGLFVALNCSILSGTRVRFLPQFDATQVINELASATVLMGVPTFFTRLLAEPEFTREVCASMRLFISGSAPLTPAAHRQFEQATGHAILERYGMTEAGMIAGNPLNGERIAGTVGFALPGVDIRIRHDADSLAASGEVGGIEIRGPNVFSGYYRRPEATSEAFTEDNWFITGDLGSLDGEGRLTIAGRDKDLIIAGGMNIYPAEVETALDNIEGIRESAVIGVPHQDLGEAAVGLVVLSSDSALTETDIIQQLTDVIARFKQPRRILFLEKLPRNTMGKIEKHLLRKEYQQLFYEAPRE